MTRDEWRKKRRATYKRRYFERLHEKLGPEAFKAKLREYQERYRAKLAVKEKHRDRERERREENRANGKRSDGKPLATKDTFRPRPRVASLHKLPPPRVSIAALPPAKGELPRDHWPKLRDVAAYRLESMAKFRRDTTMSGQKSTLRYALAELPERPTPDDWHRWMLALLAPQPEGAGLKQSSVNTYKAHVSAAYEWCRRRGLFAVNATYGIPDLPTGEEGAVVLPGAFGGPGAAADFYDRLRAVFTPEERVALALVRFCGITREELFGLREGDFDQRSWTMQLVRGKRPGLDKTIKPLKTAGRLRMLQLGDLLPERELRELAVYLRTPRQRRRPYGHREEGEHAAWAGEATDELFPWSRHRASAFNAKFRAVAPELFQGGTGDRPLHTWRHALAETAEDVLKGSGGEDTLEILRRLLGHSDLQALKNYLAKRRGTRLRPGAVAALREALQTGKLGAAARPLLTVMPSKSTQATGKEHGPKGGGDTEQRGRS